MIGRIDAVRKRRVIAELLRAEHGADMKLSRSEQEAKKADEHIQMKKGHL